MGEVNEYPTAEFEWKWHDFPVFMSVGDEEFEMLDDVTAEGIIWKVRVWGRQAWCKEIYAQTLEQPAEYQWQDEFSHVELALEQGEKVILHIPDWEGWDEWNEVAEQVESINWEETFV